MDRRFHRQNFILKIMYGLFTILTSCGPRSGIHNDENTNEVGTSTTQIRDKSIDFAYNTKGGKLYKQNCAVCHGPAQDLIDAAPDLKGIKDRLPYPAEEWFVKYTLNNERVLLSGDPYAAKLKSENRHKPMTVFEGVLTELEIREIYDFLINEIPVQAVP